MTDLSSVLEAVNLAKGIGEVGKMVVHGGNGHKSLSGAAAGATRTSWKRPAGNSRMNHARLVYDEEFSDLQDESYVKGRPAEGKAPDCYQRTMDYMAEIINLESKVDYMKRAEGSWQLRAIESAKSFADRTTEHGVLSPLHDLVPKPVPNLEALTGTEMEAISGLQKEARKAIYHSRDTASKLKAYDKELLTEFNSAKEAFEKHERIYARAEKDKAELARQVDATPKHDKSYVPLFDALNDTYRLLQSTDNKLELIGAHLMDASKQSSLVRSKENTVRAGLHELTLLESRVSRFLSFVDRTKSADSLAEQLAETANIVAAAYQALTRIAADRSTVATQSVEEIARAIGGIDYQHYPTMQREANKQHAILARLDKKTSFREQARELLYGTAAGKSQKQAGEAEGIGEQYMQEPANAASVN